MFSFVPRIRVVTEVKPWPAVKPTWAHTADIIRRQIFADFIPFVCAHPELVTAGPERDPDGIANSPRVNFSIRSVGVELENPGAISLRSIVGNIRTRTDGDVHLLASGEKTISRVQRPPLRKCAAPPERCALNSS